MNLRDPFVIASLAIGLFALTCAAVQLWQLFAN